MLVIHLFILVISAFLKSCEPTIKMYFHKPLCKIVIGVKCFGIIAIERSPLKDFNLIRRDGAAPKIGPDRIKVLYDLGVNVVSIMRRQTATRP